MPVLIRHTTPDIAPGICYGRANIGLAHTFEAEAAQVLQALPAGISAIYSSPLERCARLAAYLAAHLPGVALHYVPALQEMHFGHWELQPWDAIDQEALHAWMNHYVSHAVPGGESFALLYQRVCRWYHTHQMWLQQAAIVTHAGPIRCILSWLHHTPLHEAFGRYQVPYGAVWSF